MIDYAFYQPKLKPNCYRSSLLYVEDSPQKSPLKTSNKLGQQVPETPGASKVINT